MFYKNLSWLPSNVNLFICLVISFLFTHNNVQVIVESTYIYIYIKIVFPKNEALVKVNLPGLER